MLRELSEEDRAGYFRGIQPIWGGGLDEARFVSFQQNLARSEEARGRYRLIGWYDSGRLASGMKAYDLNGVCGGRPVRLLGIGAVYTPPELRCRGFAAAMLRTAMDEHRGSGFDAAVLFSDIGVRYYERLGFHPIESRECTVDLFSLPKARNGFREAAPGDEQTVVRLFAERRGGERRLALSRDGWTLRLQLRRLRELARARGVEPPDWGIVAEGSAAVFRQGRDTLDVLDAAWTDERGREAVLAGLRQALVRSGRAKLRFWPAHQLRATFEARERQSALAMIAPLGDRVPVPEPGTEAELALLDHI